MVSKHLIVGRKRRVYAIIERDSSPLGEIVGRSLFQKKLASGILRVRANKQDLVAPRNGHDLGTKSPFGVEG